MAKTGLDRFAFPAILRMHDHFRAALARALRGRVGRAVIDHEHVIELRAHPLRHIARRVPPRDRRE